jgi:hypothetical protein
MRRQDEKRRSDAEYLARQRDRANARNRAKKINAGYVKLNLSKPHQQQRTFSFFNPSTHSYHVLTRSTRHWSQLVSDDNPRGYSEKQKQKIADANTLWKKRSVELNVMNARLDSEMKMKEPVDDEYGIDHINAMVADINAEYKAKMADAGVSAVDDDGDISEGF